MREPGCRIALRTPLRAQTCVQRRSLGAVASLALLCGGLGLSACGSGARLDSGEPHASYPLRVLRASFPAKQSVAHPALLELEVRNSGARAVPNIAVTVDSLSYVSQYPGLAARKRPIWAIERGPGPKAEPPVESQEVSIPGGAQTNYVNTWALGRLRAGQTRTFAWHVVPVKAGTYTVHYRFAAGLAGRARAVSEQAGSPVAGALTVTIASAPEPTHVNPETGKVEPGPYKPSY